MFLEQNGRKSHFEQNGQRVAVNSIQRELRHGKNALRKTLWRCEVYRVLMYQKMNGVFYVDGRSEPVQICSLDLIHEQQRNTCRQFCTGYVLLWVASVGPEGVG